MMAVAEVSTSAWYTHNQPELFTFKKINLIGNPFATS